MSLTDKLFGTHSDRELKKIKPLVDGILALDEQMQALSDNGLLSVFVGMLTDSRSFLSFPRHEYFRRILCNMVGRLVEEGQYPRDMEFLGKMIENISYYNAKKYFGF